MNIEQCAMDRETLSELKQIPSADILIGIPSYQSTHSIGQVVKAAILGLAKYFPKSRGVVLISEGGGAEEIRDLIRNLPVEESLEQSLISPPASRTKIIATNYLGSPGKGSAVKAILEAACMLNVKACCIMDSDLRSIAPEWVELLISPILNKGFGFVTPYYSRHKYDGTITNLIAYPLIRSLYGRRVRQPIGGDFGISSGLADSLLSKDVWRTDIARFGIDIWMTTVAIQEGFTICQSFLGTKIHDEKDPGKDLAPVFVQVVGTLFKLMTMYDQEWPGILGSRPTAIFGFETEVNPTAVRVDLENLIQSFLKDVPRYKPLWKKILEPGNYNKIIEVSDVRDRYFELPFEIWVRSVYDFAVAFRDALDDSERILQALIPIYYAAVASFVVRTKTMDSHQAEELINEQCVIFEELKPHLLQRWESSS
jgi:glycosyltransferase involved in cell wall biosynthesis